MWQCSSTLRRDGGIAVQIQASNRPAVSTRPASRVNRPRHALPRLPSFNVIFIAVSPVSGTLRSIQDPIMLLDSSPMQQAPPARPWPGALTRTRLPAIHRPTLRADPAVQLRLLHTIVASALFGPAASQLLASRWSQAMAALRLFRGPQSRVPSAHPSAACSQPNPAHADCRPPGLNADMFTARGNGWPE